MSSKYRPLRESTYGKRLRSKQNALHYAKWQIRKAMKKQADTTTPESETKESANG